MMSRKYTTAAVISGVIYMLAIAALASISFSTAAFAASDHQKDTRCTKDTRGSGNPHDEENPRNPHDTQLGFDIGNPHDACVGS